jgi:hypothetical protein
VLFSEAEMRRLVAIILFPIVAFAAASLLVYKLGLGRAGGETAVSRKSIVPEVKTAEGEVQAIDLGAGTLTIVEGDHQYTFSFDDRTSIQQSGHPVAPDLIEAGSGAKVRYLKRGGKNWARRIELVAASNGEE